MMDIADLKHLTAERQDGLCFYCDSPFAFREGTGWVGVICDHFVPRSKGGVDDDYNRVAACQTCDGDKGDRMPTVDEQWKMFRILGRGKS